jgi:hypothetical protein
LKKVWWASSSLVGFFQVLPLAELPFLHPELEAAFLHPLYLAQHVLALALLGLAAASLVGRQADCGARRLMFDSNGHGGRSFRSSAWSCTAGAD